MINTYLIADGGLDIHHGGAIGVCAESHCRFLGEFAFPETIDGRLRVEHLGNSSVRYGIGLSSPPSAITRSGVLHAIESVGSERVLSQAYAATRRGGSTITVGLPAPDRMFSVPAVSLVAEERTVRGSYMGSAVPARDIPRYIALYRAGKLPVDRLLSRTFALDDINDGFDRLARGEAIRQVVVF